MSDDKKENLDMRKLISALALAALVLALAVTPAIADTDYAADAFTRTGSPGWGTADLGGSWSHYDSLNGNSSSSWHSTDGTKGVAAITTPNGLKITANLLGGSRTDVVTDQIVTVKVDNTTGAYGMLIARAGDHNSFYAAQIDFGGQQFRLRKNVNNVWTTLGSNVAGTYNTNTDYTIRFRLDGTNLMAKVWQGTQLVGEPESWTVSLTDSTYTYSAGGSAGVSAAVTTTNTTRTFKFDDFGARYCTEACGSNDGSWAS